MFKKFLRFTHKLISTILVIAFILFLIMGVLWLQKLI